MSHLMQYLVVAAGALTAVGVIGAFISRIIRNIIKSIRKLFSVLDAIDDKTKELRHNGGSSMKDTLKDTQDKLTQVIIRLDRLEKRRRWPL